ncbi:Hsp70 family protein [Candidatus Microgenomates bacterium]|nr:Hsp70 family protein [Candidatus Microgenomates bacterium]
MSQKYAYGIDFGTTNSTISVVDDNGKPKQLDIDPEAFNPSIMRSVIYAFPDGRFLFGKPAIEAYLIDVAQNEESKKRSVFTGNYVKVTNTSTLKTELVPEIIEVNESQSGRLLQSLKSALSNEYVTKLNIFGSIYELEELVGMFLHEMKSRADNILGEKIDKAIIGRPVEYVGHNNDVALERMKKALRYAGFRDFEFEYEPVGAAYDYSLNIKEEQTAIVFDFGGGTLDITVFTLPQKRILANVGLPIGGDYFNTEIFMSKIAKYFGSESRYGANHLPLPSFVFNYLQDWYKISLLKTEDFINSLFSYRYMNSEPKAIDALESLVKNNLGFSVYEEVERVKKNISKVEADIYKFKANNIYIEEEITKSFFESLITDDLNDIKSKIYQALDNANIKTGQVNYVAITGGSSLIPAVRQLLENVFGEEKLVNNNAFTSVASGLSLRAQEIFN